MLKNKKGITLVSIIITIIVMIILAGIGIATSDIIGRAYTQKITSNMILIQTKVKILMEKASFNQDTSTYYLGRKLKDQPNKSQIAGQALSASELEEDTLYVYDKETLESMGLEGIELYNDQVYIINYANGEVIFPDGLKNSLGTIVYRLSDLI